MKVISILKRIKATYKILLTLSMLLFTMSSKASVVIKHNAPSAEPARTIEVSNNVIIVTYDFSEISEISEENGSIHHSIPGFGSCYEEGYPQVPMRIDTFKIPKGYTVSISTSRTNSYQIECNYTLASGLEDYNTAENTISEQEVPIAVNELFPTRIAEINNSYTFRGEQLVDVKVHPIQFDPINHIASYSDQISYSLTIMPEDLQTYGLINDAEKTNTVCNITLQPEDCLVTNINEVGNVLTSDTYGFEGTVGYIIVTTDEYLDYAGEFANWKKYLGYSPYIISKDNWTDWEEVRNEIIACVNTHQNIQYLLILGDTDDVPAKENEGGSHPTDLYYGNSHENQYIPDLLMGRISIDNVTEAQAVLHKLMRLEMCPVMDEDYYTHAAQCGYFQARPGTMGQEELYRFILTSEEIRDYVAQYGILAQRLYNADWDADPISYSSSYAALQNQRLPIDLRFPNYFWDCQPEDIVNVINDGALYTMYRGHGEPHGWFNAEYESDPLFGDKLLFGTSHLKFLKNNPTTVFSITCLSGKFNNESEHNMPDCFAEQFLKVTTGGASAVIAASDTASTGIDDSIAEGIMDAIWPTPGLYPKFKGFDTLIPSPQLVPSYRLGQILSQALFKMKEQWGAQDNKVKYHYEIFHLFGDPSMYFHTKNPTQIKNVQISRYSNAVSVTTDEDQISIGFYDKVADKMCKFENSCATFYSENPQDVIVCLTGHNKLTYLDGTEIPVPAVEDLEIPEVSCQWINNSTVGIKMLTKQLKSDYLVTISDLNGRVVFRERLDDSILNNTVMIPFSYSNGIYIVKIEENGRTILTNKLIKK
ncbi:MAG: T9SS type A sorting domain-containing protein [Bacteroides sp.]|nr:T9SS type A sorting domain-containing protein [Bacteroides sp.]